MSLRKGFHQGGRFVIPIASRSHVILDRGMPFSGTSGQGKGNGDDDVVG